MLNRQGSSMIRNASGMTTKPVEVTGPSLLLPTLLTYGSGLHLLRQKQRSHRHPDNAIAVDNDGRLVDAISKQNRFNIERPPIQYSTLGCL